MTRYARGMRAWLVWLAIVPGCYAPKVSPGAPCSTEGTCPGGLVCVDDRCVTPGTPAADAPQRDAPTDVAVDAAVDAAPDAFVDLTLIAHWQFDDTPSNGALDSTGHGHTAACATACPTLVAGKVGMAYHFDAATQQALTVADSSAFRGNVTISAWMYADTAAGGAIMSKPVGTGTDNSWQLEQLDTGPVSFSGGSVHYLDSPTPIAPGAWHHVAGTWDGTTKRLYVDGAMVASVAATLSYDTHLVYLGADQNTGTTVLYWNGALDDVRIYDRVLGDSEIAALAQ